MLSFVFVFFFKQKTAYERRISDWSSDVCSSDLAGCDLRGAKRVAEDCRVRIASIDSQPSGHRFLVTASFGVTASSLSGYDLAKLLSHADKALYRSKREGRNRVTVFDRDAQAWKQLQVVARSEEHTSELQSLMRISFAV